VRWVSLDAPVQETSCRECIDTSYLASSYVQTVGADRVWNTAPRYAQGQKISVAIIDSGINPHQDFWTRKGKNRLVVSFAHNQGYNQTIFDGYGHGTHIAGIVGSNGASSGGRYIGIAPQVNLINVKVSDDLGASSTADVVLGMQWVLENRQRHNIRVVNLSLNSSTMESYHVSPLDAAAEVLWFNGIVVVVSAGNNGTDGGLFPPANDPFVITVGATDDRGTPQLDDDELAPFSAYGTTSDGYAKPELVAPGKNIVSLLSHANNGLTQIKPGNIVEGRYFRMSGTSTAAPIVAGAVALLLQHEPQLTPDQVKARLMMSAQPFDTPERAGAGYLDIYAALQAQRTGSANQTATPSALLTDLRDGRLNQATWNSVNWKSVNWKSVNWKSDYWGD
jgi:serine protease AprX